MSGKPLSALVEVTKAGNVSFQTTIEVEKNNHLSGTEITNSIAKEIKQREANLFSPGKLQIKINLTYTIDQIWKKEVIITTEEEVQEIGDIYWPLKNSIDLAVCIIDRATDVKIE